VYLSILVQILKFRSNLVLFEYVLKLEVELLNKQVSASGVPSHFLVNVFGVFVFLNRLLHRQHRVAGAEPETDHVFQPVVSLQLHVGPQLVLPEQERQTGYPDCTEQEGEETPHHTAVKVRLV